MKKLSFAKAAAVLTLSLSAASMPLTTSAPIINAYAVPAAENFGVSISNRVVPTGNIAQGKPYSISGNISSGSAISLVYGGVY
ncbi:MAG TPA: hypothetical protein DCZ71_03230, partial [Ruminococcus sp.]|nr:hypothetical protein [Ruminococcus sp.]